MSKELALTKLAAVISNLDKRNNSHPFVETEVERLTAQIAQKESEKTSQFVESPFFPGILFRKSAKIQRIERENAEPWENIVDYLTRRYRVDQLAQKKLSAELGISQPRTLRKNLLHLGIPPLSSSDYRDSTQRRLAEQWANKDSREKRSKKMQEKWAKNKNEYLEKIQSDEAKASRSESNAKTAIENRDDYRRNTIAAKIKTLANAKERKTAILGTDPTAKLRELFIENGLSVKAAAKALNAKIKPKTLYRWAVAEGVIKPNKKNPRRVAMQKTKDLMELFDENKNLWVTLTTRQQEAISLLKDSNGRLRTFEEIGELMGGITRAGVSVVINKAKSNIESLKKGEPINQIGRPKNPRD